MIFLFTFLFTIVVIFFFVMFFVNDLKEKQRNNNKGVQRNSDQNYNQPSEKTQEKFLQHQNEVSLDCYPDYSTMYKCMNTAWKQMRMDEAIYNDELDEYQREVARETNRVISNATHNFIVKFTSSRISIHNTEAINRIAEECLKELQVLEYLYAYVFSIFNAVVKECVRECLRENIRKKASLGDEKSREEMRLFTKDETTKNEVDELARQDLSEFSYDQYCRTVRNVYKMIPYSYYGIYMAVKILATDKSLRTKEEQDYLQTFSEYFDRAVEELNLEYH